MRRLRHEATTAPPELSSFSPFSLYAEEWSTLEADMINGLVLAVLIAAILTYVVARAGRRMGLLTNKSWIAVMTVFVIALLGLWAGHVA
jgi:hypothetical protein